MHGMKLARVGSLATAAALLAAVTTAPVLADDSAFPTVNQTAAAGNAANTVNPNTSGITGNAGNGAAGAIGLNTAGGVGNQQDNTIVLINSTSSASQGPVEDQAFTTQTSGAPPIQVGPTTSIPQGNNVSDSGNQSATIGNATALGASGNIGANAAAGQFNQQANVLVLTNKPTGYAPFSAAVAANAQLNQYNQAIEGPLKRTEQTFDSAINGQAGANSSGNVGMNSAAGAMNQQANSLYASTASSGSTPNRTNAGVFSNTTPYQLNINNVTERFFTAANASISGSAASKASGNTALNSASGVNNQQSNGTILITGVSGAGGTSTPGAGVRSTQYNEYGFEVGLASNASGNIDGNAGQSATGLLSLNSAAGAQNQQSNASIMLQGTNGQPTSTRACTQCGANLQSGYGNQFQALGTAYEGSIGGNAASGAAGLTALNSAGGSLNQQSNLQIMINGAGKGTDNTQGVSQSQTGAGSLPGSGVGPSAEDGQNKASIHNNAGMNATGAIDANATGGNGNQQMNQLLIVTGDTPSAQPSNTGSQRSAGQQIEVTHGKADASIGDNAFAGSQGAVNASVSAGDNNQQGNVMLLATSNLTDTSPAASQSISSITITTNQGNTTQGATTATLGGSAFSGASGALNANVASGVGGQQSNIMQVTR